MNDPISEAVWLDHEVFLRRRKWRERERARWQSSDWRLLRLLAESRWESEPCELYVNAVTRAVSDVAWRHALRRLESQ